MNNNFKIFSRKLFLIFVVAIACVAIFISFFGLKVSFSNISKKTNLASALFGLSDASILNENDIVGKDIFTVSAVNPRIDIGSKGNNDKEISFTFVGDIMLDRNVLNSVRKNGSGDFSFIFENIDFLDESDVTFGNLEGPASDKGEDLGNLYSFRMNPLVTLSLKGAGFDALSVANNHSADWGEEAFLDTLERLRRSGISPVGGGVDIDEAESAEIIERKGFKVGFLGFSDVGPKWFEAGNGKPGILLAEIDTVENLVKKTIAQADYIIVSFHFGNEYEMTPSERQERLAKSAIDAGANIVVGHHPHVEQKIEIYNGGLIAYSLGNFIFDQNFSKETMEGALLNVVFSGQDIVSVYKKKVKLNEFFQVYLADEE